MGAAGAHSRRRERAATSISAHPRTVTRWSSRADLGPRGQCSPVGGASNFPAVRNSHITVQSSHTVLGEGNAETIIFYCTTVENGQFRGYDRSVTVVISVLGYTFPIEAFYPCKLHESIIAFWACRSVVCTGITF